MTNHVSTLRNWLKTNYSIVVPDDWLEACVEWIEEENQGCPVQFNALKNQVYDQWLMSDLRELKTPCLPAEVLASRKMELLGTFAVQVDSAVDVGCSFYSQVQKVKGTENVNAAVSGEEPRQPAWEPKPTRMIIMEITDGVTSVKAMEYKPIKTMAPFMTPGTKMLIKGPVLCRLGMLMLGPENIQVLGGEVENLMEANTPEALLNSAMQEGQTNNGKTARQEFSGRMLTSGDEKKNMANIQPASGSRYVKKEPGRQPSRQITSVNVNRNPQIKQAPADLDIPDWEDDFDYDALMADMEVDAPSGGQRGQHVKIEPQRSQQSRNTPHQPHSVPHPQNVTHTINQVVPRNDQNMDLDHDDFMDDFDEDFDVPAALLDNGVKQEPLSQPTEMQPYRDYNRNNSASANRNDSSVKSAQGPSNSLFNSGSSHGGNPSETTGRIGKIFTKPGTLAIKEEKMSPSVAIKTEVDEFDDDFMMENLESRVVVRAPDQKRIKTETSTGISQFIQNPCATSKSETAYTSIKGNVPQAVIHPFHGTCSNQAQSSSGGTVRGNKGQSRMDRFLGANRDSLTTSPARSQSRSGSPVTGESFTYLAHVLPMLPVQEVLEVVVKGYISTLTSKLTSCQGKAWSISCKVNDGTGSLDVDLSSSVLTKLIGFSAEDSVVMKQRAKIDPSVKEVLAEGLSQCQQSLTDLSSLMRIRFTPNQSKPVIIQIIPVTVSHVLGLYEKITKKCEPDR